MLFRSVTEFRRVLSDLIWKNIETETVKKYADVEGFWHDFYNMFGFDIDGVDYDKDVDIL